MIRIFKNIVDKENKTSKTAKEFIEELSHNAEYQKRIEGRESRIEKLKLEFARDAKVVLDNIKMHGIKLKSLDELMGYNVDIEKAISCLFDSLNITYNDDVKIVLVTAIGRYRRKYDGRQLAALFNNTKSETLKWTIAHTLATTKPTNIDDWLLNNANDKAHGNARQFLFIALAKSNKDLQVFNLLKDNFTDYPGHIAVAMGYIPNKDVLAFLESNLHLFTGWVAREIKKSIVKLHRTLRA